MTQLNKPTKFRDRTLFKGSYEFVRTYYSDVRVNIEMTWLEAELWCTRRTYLRTSAFCRRVMYSHSVVGSDGVQYHWGIGVGFDDDISLFWVLVRIDFDKGENG